MYVIMLGSMNGHDQAGHTEGSGFGATANISDIDGVEVDRVWQGKTLHLYKPHGKAMSKERNLGNIDVGITANYRGIVYHYIIVNEAGNPCRRQGNQPRRWKQFQYKH